MKRAAVEGKKKKGTIYKKEREGTRDETSESRETKMLPSLSCSSYVQVVTFVRK